MVIEVVAEIVARLPEDDTVGQEHQQEVDDDQDREAMVCFMLISMVVDTIATIHCVCPSGKCVFRINLDTFVDLLVLSQCASEVRGDGEEADQPDSKNHHIGGPDLLCFTQMANRVAHPIWKVLSNCPVMIIMVPWSPLSPALPVQSTVYEGKVFLPAKCVVADTAGNGSHGVEVCHRSKITNSCLNPAEVQPPAPQIKWRPISIGIGSCHLHVRIWYYKSVPPMTMPWTMWVSPKLQYIRSQTERLMRRSVTGRWRRLNSPAG